MATVTGVLFENWGATRDETAAAMPGDEVLPEARLVATRSITLDATPGEVFPWLAQMGTGRAGWYSYDLLDNLGRSSARRVHPEWQVRRAGDQLPAGPISFTASVVDPPRVLVLSYLSPRVAFTLAYSLRHTDQGARLVTRVRARLSIPLGSLVERYLLGPADGIMLRRQLLGLAGRVAGRSGNSGHGDDELS